MFTAPSHRPKGPHLPQSGARRGRPKTRKRPLEGPFQDSSMIHKTAPSHRAACGPEKAL